MGGRHHSSAARVFVTACILLALVHNVANTWQLWGDMVIDSGRELDTPKQILAGNTLYAEIRYWYGPLAPYTNALLYRCFGMRVSTLTTAGIISAALLAWLAYRLVRLFAGRLAAAAAAVALLYINAFGQTVTCSIFCFPLPYAFPATYGMLLAVASVYFLLRHVHRRRASDLAVACLCLSLTALCKVEVVFATAAAHGVFLLGSFCVSRANWRMYLATYGPAMLLLVCVYGYFYSQAGAALWSDNLFLPGNLAASRFNLEQAGLLNISESLRRMGVAGIVTVAGCFATLAFAIAEDTLFTRFPQVAFGGAHGITPLAPVFALLCGGLVSALGSSYILPFLPVVLLFCLMLFSVRYARAAESRAASLQTIVLFTFGLAALARRVLRCDADHYGFYLTVPAILGFAVFWCRLVPAAVTALRYSRDESSAEETGKGGSAEVQSNTPESSVTAYACGIAILLGLAWAHQSVTRLVIQEAFPEREFALIRTPQGTMPCQAVYQGVVDETVRYLQTRPARTKVVAFPEGAAISFLAGCSNPLGMHSYLPLDFTGGRNDADLIRRLFVAQPDVILLLSRSMAEHGSIGFGVDYAATVLEWVKVNYRESEHFRSPSYEVTIYERP